MKVNNRVGCPSLNLNSFRSGQIFGKVQADPVTAQLSVPLGGVITYH